MTQTRIAHFATPEEAQAAFYEAIERADLAQMMAVWAEDDEIVCIHPGSKRHTGIADVRESWRQIFSHGSVLRFAVRHERTYPGRMLSVHSVYEQVTHTRGAFAPTTVVATNIFVLSNRGWQMLVHHASPIAEVWTEKSLPSALH